VADDQDCAGDGTVVDGLLDDGIDNGEMGGWGSVGRVGLG
jgi:hypothetical protein